MCTCAWVTTRYATQANYDAQIKTHTDDAVDLMARVCAARVRFGEPAVPCAPYEPPVYDSAR